MLSANNHQAIRDMFRLRPARKGTFGERDIEHYIEALSQPGALTAALNYYRANVPGGLRKFAQTRRIDAETLVIWGELDPALGLELLDGLSDVAPRLRIYRIPDASHWVQNEAPAEVNQALVDFLKGEDINTPLR
jgi:pimeloyl-ACP methyl ester carboxylesterase